MLTISASGKVSLSGVMIVLWMRNLSLHFMCFGGSSLRAWSITKSDEWCWIESDYCCAQGLTRHIDTLSRVNPARVWTDAVKLERYKRSSSHKKDIPTLGAVVLTLNATGCELLFVMVKERLTRVVSGPTSSFSYPSNENEYAENLLLKSRELDGLS